jgi:hypothetical protein
VGSARPIVASTTASVSLARPTIWALPLWRSSHGSILENASDQTPNCPIYGVWQTVGCMRFTGTSEPFSRSTVRTIGLLGTVYGIRIPVRTGSAGLRTRAPHTALDWPIHAVALDRVRLVAVYWPCAKNPCPTGLFGTID